MVVPLPHKTFEEYCRDFQRGTLEEFCPQSCPTCGAPIHHLQLRRRKVARLFLLRGKCRSPRPHHFTFLPVFLAPGKWYGYRQIEEALTFVNHRRFGHPSAGLATWEENRDQRRENGLPPGPGSTTVRRWQQELGQNHPQRPWGDRATKAVTESTIFAGNPPPFPAPQSFVARTLLILLQTLGRLLLGSPPAGASRLGVGIWFLESRHQERLMARFELAGNVVPGPIPEMAVTGFLSRRYPARGPPISQP